MTLGEAMRQHDQPRTCNIRADYYDVAGPRTVQPTAAEAELRLLQLNRPEFPRGSIT